jgi:hypothetical protein
MKALFGGNDRSDQDVVYNPSTAAANRASYNQ